MKIVILGGGLTGLTAAYYLSKTNNEITVLEKGERFGGLASGFKKPGWNWDLERTYHHIFNNDSSILSLANEIKFHSFIFSTPTTSSLFGEKNNYRIFPVDSPKDFLLLPEITFFSKLRAGFTIVLLKITPHLPILDRMSSSEFLRKTMGSEVWSVLWERLFRNKYGKYAEKILASFIWARIHKRTQKLGYPTGGFQTFIDTLVETNKQKNVSLFSSTSIEKVQKNGSIYEVRTKNEKGEERICAADMIISTLPYPITCNTMEDVLGVEYVREQKKRKYLFAVNLILKTKQPILEKTYWLNISAKDVPIMCVVQHTNFVDSKQYGGEKICYIAWYVDHDDPLLSMNEKEVFNFVLPHLKNINPNLNETPEIVALFKAPFAQPIFDKEFVAISRSFDTPAKNVYVANMDMTYPFDRGTNYAVQLGKDVSNFILNSI
jgi:protoporphyrinogen oxidase